MYKTSGNNPLDTTYCMIHTDMKTTFFGPAAGHHQIW